MAESVDAERLEISEPFARFSPTCWLTDTTSIISLEISEPFARFSPYPLWKVYRKSVHRLEISEPFARFSPKLSQPVVFD